jgi:hypothetical protein
VAPCVVESFESGSWIQVEVVSIARTTYTGKILDGKKAGKRVKRRYEDARLRDPGTAKVKRG